MITPSGGRNIRTVWTIPTYPFPQAHFATFPPALVEPCIKAGTSERGACPSCGAAWVRVVEKVGERQTRRSATNALAAEVGGTHRERTHQAVMDTIGWRPDCECGGEPIPCQCLDPFGGAGTVGLVADRLGRDAILCELNPEYVTMAEDRITMDAPLFAEVLA